MKKNFIVVAAGLGLVQLVLPGNKAMAQTQRQDSVRALKDVVISTSKVNQKQSQTGKVVTVISRQEIERSSGKSVSQLLSEQAGIIVNGANANPGLNKSIYLRGADNKHTLILLDGILIYDPSNVGGAFDLRLLAVDQIDHIEIMKGGQSTLYGSDAVAGVINIITKKGAGESPSVSGVAAAGSYGTVKGNLGLSAQAKALSYNINYGHERSDGVSEAARPAGDNGYYDLDGYSQDAVNAQFGIKVNDDFTINPFARFLQGKYNYDDGGFADANNYFTSKHLNIGTTASYRILGKHFLNFNYSYENTDRSYVNQYGTSPFAGRLNFTELYYSHQISQHAKLLIGLDNRRERINAGTTDKVDSTANMLGAYASLFLNNIGNFFNLEGGGRYTHHTKFGSQWTYSVTPSFNVLKDDQLKIFGTVSTSFKAPDLSALYGQYGANPALKAEHSQEFEAGASTSLFDGILKLRVDAYKRKVTNAIGYAANRYINQDLQDVKGIEVEPTATIGNLTLRGYYTYFKGKAITSGKELDYLYRRPANTLGLFAGYQATKRIYVSLNWRNYGQRYDLFFDNKTFANSLQSLKNYNLVDAYAEYKIFKDLKMFVDVKNIFNEKYAELYGYTALGTNFNAGLSFNIR